MFSTVIGQSHVKEAFRKAIENERLSHAYLFVGEDGVGKGAFAIELARTINCRKRGASLTPCGTCPDCKKMENLQHPDVRLHFPIMASTSPEEIFQRLIEKSRDPYLNVSFGNGNISIDLIREIKRDASYGSVEGGRKIVIIVNAERLNQTAENSLLKILEEPPPSMMILLTTTNENALLPTIRSRCQTIRFHSLSSGEIEKALTSGGGVDVNTARVVSRLADGSYAKASEMVTSKVLENRELMLDYLRAAITGKSQAVMDIIQHVTRGRDAASLREWLIVMSGWFKDLLKVFNLEGRDVSLAEMDLINIDKTEELEKFGKNLPGADLEQSVTMIERAIGDLNRKVYAPLVLINLAVELKNAIMNNIRV